MVGKHEYMNMGPRIYRVCYATGQAAPRLPLLVGVGQSGDLL